MKRIVSVSRLASLLGISRVRVHQLIISRVIAPDYVSSDARGAYYWREASARKIVKARASRKIKG